QRVPRDRAVVPRPLDRVVERAMPAHPVKGAHQIALALVEVLKRAAPEAALLLRAAPVGEHDRQGDLAVAEIVAHGLAELGLARRVVERVVDELEGDAEIEAVTVERLLLRRRALGD